MDCLACQEKNVKWCKMSISCENLCKWQGIVFPRCQANHLHYQLMKQARNFMGDAKRTCKCLNVKQSQGTYENETASYVQDDLSSNVRRRISWNVYPAKIHIRAVWSESSSSAWRVLAPLAIQYVPREDSDQPARMRRLIWIFSWRTCPIIRVLTLRLNIFYAFPIFARRHIYAWRSPLPNKQRRNSNKKSFW